MTSVVTLSDEHRWILEVEARRWKYAGAKDAVIRNELGISATAYYARLNQVLDDPAAMAHDPQTVNRLRRLRHARRLSRATP